MGVFMLIHIVSLNPHISLYAGEEVKIEVSSEHFNLIQVIHAFPSWLVAKLVTRLLMAFFLSFHYKGQVCGEHGNRCPVDRFRHFNYYLCCYIATSKH